MEALAIGQAAELMQQYDLTYTSVEDVKADRYGARTRDCRSSTRSSRVHEADWCAKSVATFMDCHVWHGAKKGTITFFGSEHDTEVAHNMLNLIRIAMEGEFARYLKSDERDQACHGRALRRPFMLGMTRRINERLDAMRAVRERATQSAMQRTGRELVLVTKREITTDKFAQYAKEFGLRLSETRKPRFRHVEGAHAAGRAAGDRVGFSSGNITASGVAE